MKTYNSQSLSIKSAYFQGVCESFILSYILRDHKNQRNKQKVVLELMVSGLYQSLYALIYLRRWAELSRMEVYGVDFGG